jgi:hypothetical protein
MCNTLGELENACGFIIMLVMEGINVIISTLVLGFCNNTTLIVSRGALVWEDFDDIFLNPKAILCSALIRGDLS